MTELNEPGPENDRRSHLPAMILCLILSGLAATPFSFMGRTEDGKPSDLQMPVTHDMHLHFEQMKSFYNGLAAGSIYPRWEEDTNRGFGAPTTCYYPPGIYYITSFFYALTGSWWRALLGMHWLLIFASGAALYFYAREVMSGKAAVLAMAAYIFLPYHTLDQYQRGALAELLGFIWMPLMMMFGERLFRHRAPSGPGFDSPLGGEARLQSVSGLLLSVAGLAASYGAFLWSHPPTAYQFTLAFGLYILILALRRRDWRGLLYCGCAMALGIALSAAYLIAAFLEQDLILHEYISESWPYHSTYVFLHALPYREPHMGFFNLVDGIWLFSTVLVIVCAAALLAERRVIALALRERAFLWAVMGCYASFMMTEPSALLGRHIPKIDIGVFTWRMLSISTLVVALLAGACAQAALERAEASGRLLRAGLWALARFVPAGGVLFSVAAVGAPMFNAPAFVPSQEHVNFATVPRTAFNDPLELPYLDKASLAGGAGRVTSERWDPQHRELSVVLDAADRLSIRTFYFPGWLASVNGEEAGIQLGERLGNIVLDLPAGTHQVELFFRNTPKRRACSTVTLCAFVVLLSLVFAASFARRRSRSAPV